MRTLTTTIAVLRTLRGELAIVAAIAVVVAFSTFVVAAIPQLQQEIFGRELRHRVANAPPDWRNLSTRVTGSPSIRGDATIIERLETAGYSYLTSLDPVLQSIISTHHYVLQSPTGNVVQLRYQPLYPFQRSLTQRVQSGTEQQITLIGGRMPQPRGPVLQSEIFAKPGARGERPVRQREVLLSATTAQDLDVELNGWLLTEPEGPPALDGPPERLLIHVVGLFTVNDPEAGYWNGDTRLHSVQISGYATDFGEVHEGMALIAEDALISAVIDTRTLDWELNWVYQVNADTITTDNEQALTDALNVLRATRGSIDVLTALLTRGPGPQSGGDGIDIRNELPQVFERFNADARTASAAIVLGATGITALALTALVMLAALIADRRRELMVLLRSRGAASRQLLAALLVESLLICVPAATAGYVLTRALIDTPALRSAQIAAALTCGAAILVWLLAARVTLFGQLGRLLGAQVALPSRRRLWRAAAEGAVVVLAITALWLIRRRGLEPSGAPDALLAVDPLLAAVPALLGLVFGLAALRLYPWAARVIGRLTHFSRGALAFVSARRIAGQSTAAALPLVVMIVAIGLSVFASVLVSSVQVTRADYVWHEVRADYRIDAAGTTSFALPARLDMSAVPGVEVQARELRTTANAERGGSNGGNVVQSRSLAFLALDIAQFAAVTDGTPVAAAFPTALTTGTPLGTIEQPLPAVISEAWPEGAGPRPGLGDTFELAVIASQFGAPLDIVVQVVEVRPDAPGTSGPFALVDWEAFAAVSAADTGRELRPSSIYLRGAPDETVLRQTIIEQALIFEAPEAGQTALPLGIRLVSRTARLSALSDAPLARGLVDSFQLAVLCAALYSVVAMGAGMILTARARRRDLSYLRTLGMSSRQAFALVLLEQAPAALVASVFGVALGILTARLIAPGIDLAAFIGPDIPVAMTDDWGAIIAIVLLLGLGVFLATVITSIFARRTQLSDVLRIGDR